MLPSHYELVVALYDWRAVIGNYITNYIDIICCSNQLNLVIGFHINIISELVVSIILHLFLLHILLKGGILKSFHL